MLIQRRPSDSTMSTFGVSGSTACAIPSARERAARRRGGRGSLGIATEGAVDGGDHDNTQSTGRHGGDAALRRGLRPPDRLLEFRAHSCTRPEGWRDWPDETPATSRASGKGANSWRRVAEAPASSHDAPDDEDPRSPLPMAVTNLACRECGTEYELTAQYVCSKCFGPLEVKYDHSALGGDVAALKRPITSG